MKKQLGSSFYLASGPIIQFSFAAMIVSTRYVDVVIYPLSEAVL